MSIEDICQKYGVKIEYFDRTYGIVTASILTKSKSCL